MSDFKDLKIAVQKQLKKMEGINLFKTNVTKDEIWNTYLDSYPAGTNEIFKERREYDCQCCKQFMRRIGNVVSIKNNKLISVWDIEVPYPFDAVVKKLSELVKSSTIKDIFLNDENNVGTDNNVQLLENNKTVKWEHFHYKLANKYVEKDIPTLLGKSRTNKETFKRAMEDLTLDAASDILDMINQGSLYRGDEYKHMIINFKKDKIAYDKIDVEKQDVYAWLQNESTSCFVRNSAIGTLFKDLSEGVDIGIAVTKYEKVTAPQNYKRPKAIFTKKMVEDAEKKIKELGFGQSLSRKFATLDEININNVMFIDRNKKGEESVFDDLKSDVSVNSKKYDRLPEINIEDLDTINSLEILMENKFQNNLMSLIGPKNIDSPSMLKWDNNFSWGYKGDVTDSLKQNVKDQGGSVTGVLRFSIQWNENGENPNDFDAHCIEPKGNLIYYSEKHNYNTTGQLDIDITHPGSKVACENITWSDIDKMEEGEYKFQVHNFAHNGGVTGFKAEIEYDGEIYSYEYDKELRKGEKVTVAILDFNRKNGITFKETLKSDRSVKEIWGIKTNTFIKVNSLMLSPNYWTKKTGNKHYFFFLEDCKTDVEPRGFYNEYLDDSLITHKRVFEALGNKMRVELSDDQLSGIGFASTKRNSIIAKVNGEITKILI